MRESIGGAGLFQIVIVLLLLFTAYFCLSINYTAAYKVTDSINNQIKKDEGINPEHISNALQEAHYTSSGKCNDGDKEVGWTPFKLSGKPTIGEDDEANYCLKKVLVTDNTGIELPKVYYYRIKVFYRIEVPIISSFNFNVQADSVNIYSPNENEVDGYISMPVVTDILNPDQGGA